MNTQTDISLILDDADATERFGAALAQALLPRTGLVVFLDGALGAGKTTLARGWLRALGAEGAIRSPTYTLIEPYRLAGHEILHMDLYRLRSPDELEGLGLDSYDPAQSWWLVEWPDQGGDRMPPADLQISLQLHEQKRKISLGGKLSTDPAVRAAVARFDANGSARSAQH